MSAQTIKAFVDSFGITNDKIFLIAINSYKKNTKIVRHSIKTQIYST